MISRLLTFIFLFTLAGAAQAANQFVPELYRFEQPVDNASQQAREAALREAMSTVLLRVTGDRAALKLPQAQGLIDKAQSYVQRYAYVQRPPQIETSDQAPLPSDLQPQLLLQGRFVESALSADIRRAGLPLWSAQRPRTLVLIAVAAPDGGYVLDTATVAEYPELAETASQRGLPLVLPAPAAANFEDVWARNEVSLRVLAETQKADYILWGQLQESAGKWLLQAALLAHPPRLTEVEEPLLLEDVITPAPQVDASALQQWRLRSRETEPLLREALQRSVDHIAGEHALAAAPVGDESLVGLWVRGLRSGDDYRLVQQHLEALPVIDSLELVAVHEGALVFRVSSLSSPEEMDRNILEAGRLVADPLPPAAGTAAVWTGEFELHYRLQ